MFYQSTHPYSFKALTVCFATVATYAAAAIDVASAADVLPLEATSSVLSDQQWENVDATVEKALAWLAHNQQRDGSFPTLPQGQPGVTSLCLLAFMAHGHLPGEGPYGEQLNRSLNFIVAQQKRSGLIAMLARNEPTISRRVRGDVGTVMAYNHAISSLVLSEAYGVQRSTDSESLSKSIGLALTASLEMQRWPKNSRDQGGWRYVNRHDEYDSDLSITGWELMFLRSAKNAGFTVPQQPIDDAVDYVRRCFDENYGTFEYEISNRDRRSRAMAGAGILALAHAGHHNSHEAQASGEWLLRHGFANYNQLVPFSPGNNQKDRYHYGVFHSCQGMYQLGGKYWEEFFPSAATALVSNQLSNGSWPAEQNMKDGKYGQAYSTSLALLALGAPNQLLPIFQR